MGPFYQFFYDYDTFIHCQGNHFCGQVPVPVASKTLIKAYKEQCEINCHMSIEWGTLINYNFKNQDSQIKHNSTEKWAKEIVLLNWEYEHTL
jgi:hypothetical protein